VDGTTQGAPLSTALVQTQHQFVAKKALFSFLGNTFRIFDPAGGLQYYIKQKAFRLREEINVFADEAQTQKRLTISAHGIGDFSGGYDIVDATSGEKLGIGKRNGFKSLFKDEWSILDADGADLGKVVEVGGFMILLRKFLKIIPQKYEVQFHGAAVGTIHQHFNPFQLAYDVKFTEGSGFDTRLGVGMVVLLLAIEGSRDGG
jgi:hypothetical protein